MQLALASEQDSQHDANKLRRFFCVELAGSCCSLTLWYHHYYVSNPRAAHCDKTHGQGAPMAPANSGPTTKHVRKAVLYHAFPAEPPADHRDQVSQPRWEGASQWMLKVLRNNNCFLFKRSLRDVLLHQVSTNMVV